MPKCNGCRTKMVQELIGQRKIFRCPKCKNAIPYTLGIKMVEQAAQDAAFVAAAKEKKIGQDDLGFIDAILLD
jgi:tRNA(Ile2) C34 agmatinyltransferase TiaS